jgi:hypothetical protein
MISFSQGSQRILVVASAGRDVGHPWTVPAGPEFRMLMVVPGRAKRKLATHRESGVPQGAKEFWGGLGRFDFSHGGGIS